MELLGGRRLSFNARDSLRGIIPNISEQVTRVSWRKPHEYDYTIQRPSQRYTSLQSLEVYKMPGSTTLKGPNQLSQPPRHRHVQPQNFRLAFLPREHR